MNKAFTMVELVFAIVIIGILASVAIPKLAVTRDDAEIVRARTTIAALRTAISTERSKRVLRGIFTHITGAEAVGLLNYGVTSDWVTTGDRLTFTGPGDKKCYFDVNNSQLLKVESTCEVAGFGDL